MVVPNKLENVWSSLADDPAFLDAARRARQDEEDGNLEPVEDVQDRLGLPHR
jgi:hypothetical protein